MNKKILIVSQNLAACQPIIACFQDQYDIECSTGGDNWWAPNPGRDYAFIFAELDMLSEVTPGKNYPDRSSAIVQLRSNFPGSNIVITAPHERISEIITAVRAGAAYLTSPLDISEVKYIKENIELSGQTPEALSLPEEFPLVGGTQELTRTNSPVMERVYDLLHSAAATDTTVLIAGEPGVGKGVLARLLHHYGPRSERPFVVMPCDAFSEEQAEQEIFGSSADSRSSQRNGRLALAQGGTLFLREVQQLPLALQSRLAQVLETQYTHQNESLKIKADYRVISSTSVDLRALHAKGLFDEHLFYLLTVFPVFVPPLRERIEDILLFVELFLNLLNQRYGKGIYSLHPDVLHAFLQHNWPGNLPELRALVERAYVVETGPQITPASIQDDAFRTSVRSGPEEHQQRPSEWPPLPDARQTLSEARRQIVEWAEREYLHKLLTSQRGRINRTAEAAGITTRQLHKLMTKYGLQKKDYK